MTTGPVLVKSLGHGTSIVAVLFTIIGSIAGAVCAYATQSQLEFLRTAVHAEGRVIANQRDGSGSKASYHPVVQFSTEDGEPVEFRGDIGSSPPAFDVGEVVGVRYQPDHPADARINTPMQMWFASGLSGFFALIFGGIGVGLLVPLLLQRRRAAWAREHGQPVSARFATVVRDTTTKVNGRSPFKVYADWRNPLDGKVYRFQSQKALWSDPTEQLTQRPDIALRVDPQQPKRYWLDLGPLKSS